MDFLKKLFGGGGGNPQQNSNDVGIYFYVRPRGCEEVIQVRVDMRNDPSLADDGGYIVRKTVRGSYRCFNPVEMTLVFNKNRQLAEQTLDRAEFVSREDYEAWQEKLSQIKANAANAVNAPTED